MQDRKRHLILQFPEHNLSVFSSSDDTAALFIHPYTGHSTCVALYSLTDFCSKEVPDEQVTRLTSG